MSERIVTVVPKAGLHARPASKVVETANEYDCTLEIGAVGDGDPVNAQSMLAVTSLGVAHDEQVRLVADGADADTALDALEEILSTPEESDEEPTK